MSIELKPCPFCGGSNLEVVKRSMAGFSVESVACEDCMISAEKEIWQSRAEPHTHQPVQETGAICKACCGKGEWTDAEPGDISFNTYRCKECLGIGASGLVGEILHYLRKVSLGHDEVDAVAIANLAQPVAGSADVQELNNPTVRVRNIDNIEHESTEERLEDDAPFGGW